MNASSIACLKVTLDEVTPKVQRRIEVPLLIRLDRLHLVLQAALGWTNSHLYEIRAGGTGWGMPDPDYGGGPLAARKARLADVLEDTDAVTFRYLYDFGEHTVKVERVVEAVPGITTRFRRLVEDYERYTSILAALHLVAFVCLMLKQAARLATGQEETSETE